MRREAAYPYTTESPSISTMWKGATGDKELNDTILQTNGKNAPGMKSSVEATTKFNLLPLLIPAKTTKRTTA
ncbi:Uncharacterised protein [uncultured archaeon]|nr:Uncharacterised protein [uncultured archaeon]